MGNPWVSSYISMRDFKRFHSGDFGRYLKGARHVQYLSGILGLGKSFTENQTLKKLSVGITLITMLGALALPAATQIIPPWIIGDQPPPETDVQPEKVNPFETTLTVTLDAAGATHIYYDINNDAEFDPENATELEPGAALPVITSTSVIRAVAYSPTGRYSDLVSWTYTKSDPPVNAAPTVAILTPQLAATLAKGSTYPLTASASDPDGPLPLTVTYQYSQAGGAWIDIGTGTGGGFSLDWTIGSAVATGATQLRATATDGLGAATVHQVAITIIAANTAPTVSITSPVPNSSFISPPSITISTNAADPGGAVTRVDFFLNGEATPFATRSSAPWSTQLANPPAGSYSVTAVAYDNGSPPPQRSTTSAAVAFTVAANHPPKPVIDQLVDGRTYYEPFNMPISATVTDEDPNSSITQVVFRNGNTVESVDLTAPWAYTKEYLAGTYKFTATATDNLGDSAISDTVRIIVAANQAPVARAGDDTIITMGAVSATVALKGGASSDPEGTDLRYEWTGPAGVTFTGGATPTPTAVFSAPGSYTINLRVTDQGTPAQSGTDKVVVTVYSRPAISSPLTASGTAAIRFGYLMSATGNPAPTLSAPSKPDWLTQKTGTDSLVGTPPESGPVTVTLVATNAAGTDTRTLSISISDSLVKPSITSLLSGAAKTGVAYSYTITSRGNPSPTFTTSVLPAGLTLKAGGIISGSPTVSGNFSINLTATNTQGFDTKVLQLSITSDPRITTDLPDSLVITERTRAAFEIRATGYPAIYYEWQYGAAATGPFTRVGGNSSVYAIDSATFASAGFYRVIVRNNVGPDVTSRVCRLRIKALPIPITIVSPRMGNPTVVVGSRVPFKVKATGPPRLLFQWFKGSTAVTAAPKEQDTLYVIQRAALSDGGDYYARVSDAANPGTFKHSDTAHLWVQQPKLPKPFARPAGGPFHPTTKIAFGNDTAGTAIYWTNNGSDPSQTNGNLFNGDSILVDATRSFKARAYKANFQPSDILFETYTFTDPGTVIKPQIRPLTPTFKVSMNCTLSTATPGATIYYTKDPAVAMVPFGTSITLDRTTTIYAVARLTGKTTSDTLKMTYTLESISSKVLTPTITPGGGDFNGSTMVALDCATDSSSIYYTKDGSSPDSSATRILYVRDSPVTLSSTTFLRVVAVRKNFLNSEIVTRYFRLIPGPITASPAADIVFDKDFTVYLTAQPAGSSIRYTTEGSTPNSESPEFPSDGLTLTTTTKISAVAVKDGISSTIYSFGYTKKGGPLVSPTPVTSNNQSTFKDTLSILLYSSTQGSKIYYTLNGATPAAIPSNEYLGPFRIDSTVNLQAIATHPAFINSKVLVATYTLMPERPTATPPGGSSLDAVTVRLKSISRRAKIFYSLDGEDPTPLNWIAYDSAAGISITSSKTLKAIAVAGTMASPVMEENYVIFADKGFTLPPGQTAFLEGGYTIRSPEDQGATVEGRIAGPASYKLVGFDGVQYVLTLVLSNTPSQSTLEFPKLTFTRPTSDKRGLYNIDLSGNIYFISGADTATLQKPGTYFMGIDVAPPAITYRGQEFTENGATQVTFQINDNVSNLSYDLKRSDDPTLNLGQQSFFAGQDVKFALKHPSGTLKPLYMQLIVSDYHTASFFPPETGTQFPLSQKLVAVKSPPLWYIGSNAEYPFDFLSIPLSLKAPLTLKDLRTANSAPELEGVAWIPDPIDPEKGKYLPIPETEIFLPGQAYWVGSRTRINTLSLASAETVPTDKGTFSVRLKTGWNQIANPHLDELYWPYSRKLVDAYKGFTIKGLWEYDAVNATFKEAESLKPWRGYYVYNYQGETSVALLPRPNTAWASKKIGGAGRTSLSMGWGGSSSLRLGADFISSDGLGLEDEFSLPRHKGELSIRALRNGSSLNSDWVRLNPEGIQEWKVAMEGSGDSLPSLRILAQELPDGHETWAVSLSRSMKFRLEQDKDIPASGLAKDTLLIYSGHKDQLARLGLLQRMSTVAPSLDLNVFARNGGFNARIFLPSKARILATVWSLQGSRLGELALGPLSGGEYGFAFETDFRNRPARLAPGMYFLSLEVRGPGLQKRLARKLVIPN